MARAGNTWPCQSHHRDDQDGILADFSVGREAQAAYQRLGFRPLKNGASTACATSRHRNFQWVILATKGFCQNNCPFNYSRLPSRFLSTTCPKLLRQLAH
jgi:hypothetical protein